MPTQPPARPTLTPPAAPAPPEARVRIGVMGGTFDPIHYGHLFVAEEARSQFKLNRVLFVPNGTPPHKKEYQLTSPQRRYAMTLIGVHGNSGFSCSGIETQRSGPSYAVDTLTALKSQMPNADLFFITGADAISDILSWNRHEEVIKLATFIAATRPGFQLTTLKDRLPMAYLERILVLTSTTIGISSSDIRERARNGLPVRYLLPDAVLDYIVRCGLYRPGSGAGSKVEGD